MQLKNKFIKQFITCFLILLAIWVAVPREFVNGVFDHRHSALAAGHINHLSNRTANDSDTEKYNKPAYFNIFKFISSFIPVKTPATAPERKHAFIHNALYFGVNLFRESSSNL